MPNFEKWKKETKAKTTNKRFQRPICYEPNIFSM